MTVLSTELTFSQYVGNGVQTFFPFGFAPTEDFTLFVVVNGELKIEGEDFTRQAGGITFFDAPASGVLIFIGRASGIDQLRDWRVFGPFEADKTEQALDKLIRIKAEAVDWRGKMNLATVRTPALITLTNDKGSDAIIKTWRGRGQTDADIIGQVAGGFAGEVNEDFLPPRLTRDEVESKIYMSWDAGGGPPDPPDPGDPSAIAGMVTWLRAESEYYRDNVGDLSEGGDFYYWQDSAPAPFRYGYGRAGFANLRPDTANGFDGVRMVLEPNSPAAINPGVGGGGGPAGRIPGGAGDDEVTIVAVASVTGAATGAFEVYATSEFSLGVNYGGYGLRLLQNQGGQKAGFARSTGGAIQDANITAGPVDGAITAIGIRSDGTELFARVNNTDLAPSPVNLGGAYTSPASFGRSVVGEAFAGGANDIVIHEVIGYNRMLTPVEFDTVMDYLVNKFGIT